MKNNQILESDMLDIVFEGRNKIYGAYELRRNYHKRARKALMICVLLAGVLISIPLLANIFMDEENGVKPIICHYPLSTLPTTETKKEIKEIKETKVVEDVKTVKNLPPKITPSETVDDNDKMPAKEDLKDAFSGEFNNENGQNDHPGTMQEGSGNELTTEVMDVKDNKDESANEKLVFVEVYPEFPGGEDDMFQFIHARLKYPRLAVENGIEGKVVIEFLVNEKGEIKETKIVRGLKYGCDDEALRVINSMPLWKPGKQNGKPVSVYYTLPIQFTLADK